MEDVRSLETTVPLHRRGSALVARAGDPEPLRDADGRPGGMHAERLVEREPEPLLAASRRTVLAGSGSGGRRGGRC